MICTCNAQRGHEHNPHSNECLTRCDLQSSRWVCFYPDLWELMCGDRCIARVIRFMGDNGDWSICYSHMRGIASSFCPTAFAAMAIVDENLNITR